MALTFDVTAIADDVRLTTDPETGKTYMSAVTETMIFATMMAGIGTISEKTAPEFYARLAVYQALNGALVSTVNDDGSVSPRPLTEQDVRDHLGLKTNARFDVETRASWVKRVVGFDLDAAVRAYKASAPALQTA